MSGRHVRIEALLRRPEASQRRRQNQLRQNFGTVQWSEVIDRFRAPRFQLFKDFSLFLVNIHQLRYASLYLI